MDLQGKVAIVTGGSRGIGRASSLLLAERGARVVVNDSAANSSAAEQLVEEITAGGGEAMALQADVLREEQFSRLVGEVLASYGRIDILVCNASIDFEAAPFADLTWSSFAAKVLHELKAAFVPTQAVMPYMMERRYGRLVYVSDTLGKDPSPCMISQGTAKGGLNSFAAHLAQELGVQGITANVVAPGHVNAEADGGELSEHEREVVGRFTPLGRIAEPDDVASVIAFLASDDARFLTGTYTPVTGGLTME
ncbi:SDR family NAD(P)-dependent oxidoreductase [Cohnella sp.]|uniref:SDR family NAD(P)-dependent oxidoreductase n=1 Tax=Cohnella sp. TaxID=1883426 RepID=UPI003567F6A1